MGDFPLPIRFHFKVEWDESFEMGFTEVSGLDFETEVIEYRHGNAQVYNKIKQPGLTRYGNVTLKRGTFKGDLDYYNKWKNTYYSDERDRSRDKWRRCVTIKLLNEEHEPIITWHVKNAWPSKVQSTDLEADANEVSIESLELEHEGLSITYSQGTVKDKFITDIGFDFVPVRRFFSMVEEATKDAVKTALTEPVFESKSKKIRAIVRDSIANFLIRLWQTGVLTGATKEDAFYVKVRRAKPKTKRDTLHGRLEVEVGMAVVRPAEFIILKFSHKMKGS